MFLFFFVCVSWCMKCTFIYLYCATWNFHVNKLNISLHDLTAIKKWMRLGTCIIISIDYQHRYSAAVLSALTAKPRVCPVKEQWICSGLNPSSVTTSIPRLFVYSSSFSPRSLPPHPRLQVWRRCNALLNGRQRRGGKETRIFATQWWLGRPWWRRWLGRQWVTIRFRCLREQIISVA